MTARTILITGANRGLGLALAQRYHAEGWRVLATCRKPRSAHALREIVEPLELDVTAEASLRALSERLRGEPIDILFSNAGVFGPRGLAFADLSREVWLEVLDVNAVAPVRLAQAFIDNVAKSQERLIAVMSSDLGSVANTVGGEVIYRTSKAALNMAVATLAKDLEPRGVRTVAVSPGWVRTDMGGSEAALSPEESARGIHTTLASLPRDTSGVFVKYDGSSVAW